MSVPFDQQRTQSGNSIFEDVYVYGCLHVSEKCGIILTSPNGTKYSLAPTMKEKEFAGLSCIIAMSDTLANLATNASK